MDNFLSPEILTHSHGVNFLVYPFSNTQTFKNMIVCHRKYQIRGHMQIFLTYGIH
jgi:hypothetical protein